MISSDIAILEALKAFAQAVEGMFEGHRKAFELIAKEHDKMLGVYKEQQAQINDLEKAVSILRVDLNELKFKEDNI